MEKEIPVACSLTEAELQNRRQTVLPRAARSLIDAAELADGFAFRFPADDEVLQDLFEIISLERKCCPFLNFKLTAPAGADFLTLELTGRDGTKAMIQTLFEWN